MAADYQIPISSIEHEYEIKKSRFITRVAAVTDRQQAMQLLLQAKRDYPDARHHCWAYLLGPPQQPLSQAFNDDGEPSGTAGKPILNVLNHGQVGDVMVIVIRYFGGVKLGAGGLVRSYSTATQQAMELISTCTQVSLLQCRLICDFSKEDKCRRYIQQLNGNIINATYTHNLCLHIELPEIEVSELNYFCREHKGVELVINEEV